MFLLSGAPVLMCTETARWRQCGCRGSFDASASSTSARFGCGLRKSVWSLDAVRAENSFFLQIRSFAEGDQGFWHSRRLGCGRLRR
jgi:hypothetical protein